MMGAHVDSGVSLIRVMYLQSYQLSQDSTDSTTTANTGQLKVKVKASDSMWLIRPAIQYARNPIAPRSPTGLPTAAFTSGKRVTKKQDGWQKCKSHQGF